MSARRVRFLVKSKGFSRRNPMSARLFETLESRQLLSASPTMSPLTSPVQLDHDQIQADLLKFRSDGAFRFRDV